MLFTQEHIEGAVKKACEQGNDCCPLFGIASRAGFISTGYSEASKNQQNRMREDFATNLLHVLRTEFSLSHDCTKVEACIQSLPAEQWNIPSITKAVIAQLASLLKSEFTHAEVAIILGVHERTITRWVGHNLFSDCSRKSSTGKIGTISSEALYNFINTYNMHIRIPL